MEQQFEINNLDLNPNSELTTSVDLWQVTITLLIQGWLCSQMGRDLLHKIVKIKQAKNNAGLE